MIVLPWPPKELSPNARIHYRAKAASVRNYRESAHWLTVASKARPGTHLTITFSPPDRRRRDLDNMLASIKAGLDGVADALGINDRDFELTLRRAEPVKNGRVLIEVAA